MIRPPLAPPSHWPAASRRPLWAWGLSLGLHVLLLTAIGLYATRTRQDATPAGESDRPISVAVVHRLPDRQTLEPAGETEHDHETSASDALSTAPQTESNPSGQPQSAAVPPDFAPPIDLDGVLAELTSSPNPQVDIGAPAAELDATGLIAGVEAAGPGGRGLAAATAGSRGTVSLFGVSGTGSRFVYVVDRSDSMNRLGGRPLRAAKAELRQSLAMLSPAQSFQLVLYNDQPRPYRATAGPVQMLSGEPDAIDRVQRFVDSFTAIGGTNHVSALQMALRMGPDVVFFLTDGHTYSLSPQELAAVRRMADRSGTVIHGIEFGTDPVPHPDSFVRRLATDNGGQYRYFDISSFSDAGKWRSNAVQPNLDNLNTPATPSLAP